MPSYDEYKVFWDKWKKGCTETNTVFDLERFVSYCNIKPGETLLEIGVGGGDTYTAISKITTRCFFGDFHYNAVYWQKKRNMNIQIAQFDGLYLPYKSKIFDKVLIRYVIHSLPTEDDRMKFLYEAGRVLKENGVMVLGKIPNKFGGYLSLRKYIRWKSIRSWIFGIQPFFTPLNIRKLNKTMRNMKLEVFHKRTIPTPAKCDGREKVKDVINKFGLSMITSNPLINEYVDLKYVKKG